MREQSFRRGSCDATAIYKYKMYKGSGSVIKNSKFVTLSLHKATANKASAFHCRLLIQDKRNIVSSEKLILRRDK